MDKILLKDFCKYLNYEIIYDNNQTYLELHNPYISRPGIQLTGFYEYFDNDRIQLFGKTESSYLSPLSKEEREKRIRVLFKHDLPCVIASTHATGLDVLSKIAKEENIILLKSNTNTNVTINKTISYLEELFAPITQRHGVLVEVTGVGIFLTGDSGIGKSELALELIKRGHRLVADDLVNIKRVSETKLQGSCPELLQYFMEIRGIGILDVRALFGMGAIKESVGIDIIVNLEKWSEEKYYERIGIEQKTINILGVDCKTLTIPVVTGRNMAVIVETVARNFRVLEMNYNASQVFCDRVEFYNNKKTSENSQGNE